MSVATEIQRLQTAKANIKTAIEGKGVTVPSATTIDGYASLIGQISQGVQEAEENDVNFYDYDGFRVASFTIAEAKALTLAEYNAILPPTHEGLTFQEWNWTLNDIQTYDRQYADIGANYITTDGKTHCFLDVNAGDVVLFKIKPSTGGSFTVSWGDGSADETITAETELSHTYSAAGNYDMTFTLVSGSFYFELGELAYPTFLAVFREIRAGNGFTIGSNWSLAYVNCLISLTSTTPISLIRGLHSANVPAFVFPRNNRNHSLNNYFPMQNFIGRVVFPNQISRFGGQNVLSGNLGMTHVVIPDMTYTSDANIHNTDLQYLYDCEILSLPLSAKFASSSTAAYFSGCRKLKYLDVPTGFVPNVTSIRFSYSLCWTGENIVKFFNKLGTTTNAITLTFGATNLAKLTAEEKAIATNKGYTLA